MRMFFVGGLLLSLAVVALAGSNDSAAKVKVASKVSQIGVDGTQTVTVTLKVDPGWHIYANPVRHKDLVPAATTVSVTGKNAVDAKIDYPPGKLYTDKYKERYMVYDQVDIPVTIRRTAGDGPLEVSVTFSACDDAKCLKQSTVKIAVP